MTQTPALFHRILLSGTALALVGCVAAGHPQPDVGFNAPRAGDDGVEIARSELVGGVSQGASLQGKADDCSGPGLGVVVGTTRGDDRFLFDKNGEPCDAAQTLFDGRSPLAQRQADPAISLNFYDSLGPKPEKDGDLPALQPLPEVRVTSELLSDMAKVEPAAGPAKAAAQPAATPPAQPDPLLVTLNTWERQDQVYAARSSEASEAAERNLNKIIKDRRTTTTADATAKLMAELRERERQVQEEQRRHAETLKRAEQNRDVTIAAKNDWKQKENELQNQLEATQKRLAEFESMAQRLNADKASKEKAYQEQIRALSSDLKAAEQQADVSRRELVLQAAAKIAEAEQLASAAKLQEQQIKLREAARLKAEAETMMDRALAMKAGQNVVVGGVGAPPAVPMALMETPVTVVANGKTLPDILNDVLAQAAPQAGQWKADWQLSAANKHILKEKWSLTAEAPVEQVLSQLNQQVKASYRVSLTFTQFGQSQLLVVTDATALSAEAAE